MNQSTCTVDGCDSALSAKGMCKPHYSQDYYRRTLGAEISARQAREALAPLPTEKACTACGDIKPLDAFNVNARNKATGREPTCKACRHERYLRSQVVAQARQRSYYWRNREHIRARKAAWWRENKEVGRAKNASNHRKYNESRSASAAARRLDPEYSAAARRRTIEWRRANPGRAKVQDLLRHRRLREAGRIPFTQSQLEARIAFFGDRCWMCRGPWQHLDHVKPVALGGMTTLANLRPACSSCNSRKRARWYGVSELHRFTR